MVGDARLLLLLPLETTKVAPDNTVVLTLKPGNQTSPRLTQLIIVVSVQLIRIKFPRQTDNEADASSVSPSSERVTTIIN